MAAGSTLSLRSSAGPAPTRADLPLWPRNERAFKARARALDRAAAGLRWTRPAIVISGFWRSGTTWLQESLASGIRAKTVFEPFSPLIPRYDELLRGKRLRSGAARHAFIPGLRSTDDAELWSYIDQAMRGYCPGDAALICRHSLAESVLRRVAVKFVRLQFSLGELLRRYDVPLVHIRRDPLAVTASLLRAKWDWSFDEVTLEELLVGHGDGREALIGEAVLEHCLRTCDGDAVSRIAAYWAITERAAAAQLDGRPRCRIIDYDQLRADPARRLPGICAELGLSLSGAIDWTRESPVTTRSADNRPRRSRPDGWREVLSREEAVRVMDIVEALLPVGPAPTRPAGSD